MFERKAEPKDIAVITRQQKRNGKLLKKQQSVIPAKPLVTDSEAATSAVIESTESGNTSTEATPALEDNIVGEEDTLTAATPATDNDVHENTSIEEVVITDDKVAEPIITEEAEENDECESGIQTTINVWRELGKKKLQRFRINNGLLTQEREIEWGTFGEVIVVPKSWRNKLMELGHEKMGHLRGEKVLLMIKKRFIWPNMKKEIYQHCSSCTKCQYNSKYQPKKASMVPRPVITKPFQSVAIDLVGPLPKERGGCHFILTSICQATRWPSAIVLKSTTSRAVAEALWTIFSNTTIPEKILSDKGPQFMSAVMKDLTSFLGITHVTSSAYHPQTNGCLERVHGTFKSILKKCISCKTDWVQQIPFVLFVLRQMPNSEHGFSPFELIYGSRSRTPLEALYFGLNEFNGRNLKTGAWVNDLADKLQLIRDKAALATAHTIEKRKKCMTRIQKTENFKLDRK